MQKTFGRCWSAEICYPFAYKQELFDFHNEFASAIFYVKCGGAVDLQLPRWCLQPLNFDECFEIKGQFDYLGKKLCASVRYYPMTDWLLVVALVSLFTL